MLHDFSAQFQHFFLPDDQKVEAALKSGLVVLDTNVLLSSYRFAAEAREQLLSVVEKLSDRLFLPHQVALEFHRSRIGAMREHGSSYAKVIEALRRKQAEVDDDIANLVRELANRTSLSDEHRDEALALLSGSLNPIREYVENLLATHRLGKSGSDDVLARLQRVFVGKVGSPFDSQREIQEIKEFARRAAQKVPPGYKDAPKHGDYFIWKQALEEAKRRKAGTLLLVTGDVKEDWYLRVEGKSISARPELVEEAYKESGARLIVISTKGLLYDATRFLDATVSDETIRQAEEIRDENALESEADDRWFYLRRLGYKLREMFGNDPGITLLEPRSDGQYDFAILTDRGTATIVLMYVPSGFLSTRRAREMLQRHHDAKIGGVVCVMNGMLTEHLRTFNSLEGEVVFVNWNSDADDDLLRSVILRNIR